MFKSILVPTDLTDRSYRALDVAVKIAVHDGATVTLLHVVETIQDVDVDDFQEFYDKLERRAHKLMNQVIDRYGSTSLLIEKEVTFGNRVRDIIAYAHTRNIDLIVLTSHRIEPAEGSQGWGTISYKVGVLSHCPVMLVK